MSTESIQIFTFVKEQSLKATTEYGLAGFNNLLRCPPTPADCLLRN